MSAPYEPRIDDEVRGSSDRGFGITFTVVFLLVTAWAAVAGKTWWYVPAAAAAATAAVTLIRPHWLQTPNRLWMRFGLILASIVNPIVMGVVYFGVITPMALVMRFTRPDPLRRRTNAEAPSYWIERTPPGPTAGTMTRQF